MSEGIIVALLALVGTLAGSWAGIRQANKLVCYRIEQLEIKVEKHNHLVERMTKVEQRVDSAHQRIDDLKEEI